MISALPWGFSLLEVTITRGKAPVQASFRAAWHCSGVRFSTTSLEMAQSSCGVVKTLSRAALWAMAEARSSDLAVAQDLMAFSAAAVMLLRASASSSLLKPNSMARRSSCSMAARAAFQFL